MRPELKGTSKVCSGGSNSGLDDSALIRVGPSTGTPEAGHHTAAQATVGREREKDGLGAAG